MKRNFLLMLLLTLLPLVGWAVTFKDGVVVTIDPSSPVQQTEQGYVPTVTVTYLPDNENESQPLDENAYSLKWLFNSEEVTPSTDHPFINAGTYTLRVTALDNLRFAGDDDPTMVDGYKDFSFVISESGTSETSTETFLIVNPQTTCVMTWGLPFELGVNDIIVTPNVSNTVKEKILEIIKINQDLSSQDQSIGSREFTIGLKDNDVRTVEDGGTTYTIQATGKGEINIQKGTNELVDGWENSVTLAQNLVFNGLKQNLVIAADYTFTSWSAAEGGNGYGNGQVAVIGEVKEPALGADEGEITYTGIKVLTNNPANNQVVNAEDFIGKTFYVIGTASNLPTERLQLYAYEEVDGKQELVAQPIWVEVKNTQLTTYAGAYEFFSISKADYIQAHKDAAIAAYATANNKTVDQLTDEEKATAVQGLQIPIPETYEFGTENPVLKETWVKEGELPQGRNAGEYFVWVRATEGGDKYSADKTVEFVGRPEIAKADPVLTGAFAVTNPCYIWTDEHAVHGVKAFNNSITETLKVNVKEGEDLIPQSAEELNAGDIEYFVKVGTKDTEGNITYAWLNGRRQDAKLTEDVKFEVGYYQLVARSKARANYNKLDPKNSDVTFDFVVVKPSVAIQTLVKGETSANYGYGVKPQADDYDWEVAEWTGYEGPDIKKANIEVSYTWYDAQGEEVDPETNNLPVGIYTVKVDGPFVAAAGEDFDYVVNPATVYIGETNILAAVEDQTLVFGQELPLKLKYSQGAFTPNTESGAAQIKSFENTMWATGFKAKMIKDANGDAVEDAKEIKLYSVRAYDVTTGRWPNQVTNTYYRTTILPVGTYTVSADVAYADNDNYTIAAAAGTWTVTAKDINNEDFGNWQDPHDADDTPEPRVKGMGGTFKLSKTYTSEEITLYGIDEDGEEFNDLEGKFTYRKGFVGLPEGSEGQEPTPEQIEEFNKQTGFYYGSLLPGEDFEITSYTNNINAGTATFHVKGIGNFTGEKDLTFTIDKAKIYVFPEIKEGGNKWAVGSPQEDAFQVDWESKTTVPVTVKQEATSAEVALIPRGIKHQLHAFKNDRPLVKPEIVNSNGFKDLKVQFIQGATVGEYEEGLQAYLPEDAEEADNYEFVFQTAPLTIVQGTIVLAVETIDANHNKAVTYSGTTRPRAKDAAGTFTLAPADKQVQELDPALQQQWWKVMSDKQENGDPWTITWEDNLDDLKQEIAGSNPKAYRYRASDALSAPESYKIKCKGFENGVTFSSTNYKFILADGADEAPLTVKRADVTITVDNGLTGSETPTVVKKNYKDFIDAAAEWNADPKNASNQKTAEDMMNEWIATIGQVKDANGNITDNDYVKFDKLQPGDVFTDLVASVTVNGDNEIIITAVDNKNYNIDEEEGIVDGTLVITPVEGTFALTSEPIRYHMDGYGDFTNENGYDLPEGSEPIIKNPWGCVAPNVPADVLAIKANDKVPYETVTLKLKAASLDPENEAYSQWKAGEWHTMVLPFATTVADVCSNFKYAIVNVVDPEATEASAKPNDVHFKLQEIMDPIPANTPFCIKSQFDFDYNTTLVFGKGGLDATGEPIVIEYKDEEDVWSDAGKGFKFRGNYDVMLFTKDSPNVRFLGPNSRWKKITSDAKYTMQPYTGYVDLGSLKETREINFIFEEEDGSTTSINAAEMNGNKSAEGLYRIDGIKLQGAPTQKGVYIQDGKKFVK